MRRELDRRLLTMGVNTNVYKALGKDLVKRLRTYIKLMKKYQYESPPKQENETKGKKEDDADENHKFYARGPPLRKIAPLPHNADLESIV